MIELKYKLSKRQLAVFESGAKVRLFVGGRRAGKTHAGAIFTILQALQTPGGHTWICAPTYPLLKVAERKFFELMPYVAIKARNRASHEVVLFNNHLIEFRSLSDADQARGPALDWAWIDEAALIVREAFDVLKAATIDKGGRILLTTTPRGFNSWLYDLCKGTEADVELVQLTSFANPFLTKEAKDELRALADSYDKDFYDQEILGHFVSRGVGLVVKIDRSIHVRPCPRDERLPIYIGQDFNLDPMCSVLIQEHGEEVWIVGEVIGRDTNVIEHGSRLIEQGLQDSIIVCDPSGSARQHNTGQSAVSLLRSMGFRVEHSKASVPQEDSINAVRALAKNADGKARLFIDNKNAPKTLESLERLSYKEGQMVVDKSGGWDHCFDALKYYCHHRHPVVRKTFGAM